MASTSCASAAGVLRARNRSDRPIPRRSNRMTWKCRASASTDARKRRMLQRELDVADEAGADHQRALASPQHRVGNGAGGALGKAHDGPLDAVRLQAPQVFRDAQVRRFGRGPRPDAELRAQQLGAARYAASTPAPWPCIACSCISAPSSAHASRPAPPGLRELERRRELAVASELVDEALQQACQQVAVLQGGGREASRRRPRSRRRCLAEPDDAPGPSTRGPRRGQRRRRRPLRDTAVRANRVNWSTSVSTAPATSARPRCRPTRRAAQRGLGRVDQPAQARAGQGLVHVGPQQRGQVRARNRPGVQAQVGQQRDAALEREARLASRTSRGAGRRRPAVPARAAAWCDGMRVYSRGAQGCFIVGAGSDGPGTSKGLPRAYRRAFQPARGARHARPAVLRLRPGRLPGVLGHPALVHRLLRQPAGAQVGRRRRHRCAVARGAGRRRCC